MPTNNTEDSELEKQLTHILRAYRHADTDDLELLTTTIERPDMIEVQEANGLTETVVETLQALITQRELDGLRELLDEHAETCGAVRTGEPRDWCNCLDIVKKRKAELTAQLNQKEE